MSDTSASASPISARVAAILIAVAAISFGAVLVMAGWAPEMRDRNQAGDHPYSTSAIGYNGLVRLLESVDYPVEVSRLESDLESRSWGLMIITLPAYGGLYVLDDKNLQPTTLAVLPRWLGRTDPMNATRQADTRFIDARDLNDTLRAVYPQAEILRVPVPGRIETLAPPPPAGRTRCPCRAGPPRDAPRPGCRSGAPCPRSAPAGRARRPRAG